MKRFNSIKKYRDFQKVYKTGKSYANRLLIMYVMRTKEETDTRIGISVSKKVGNSVVRHHITRLLRESYRLNKDMVKTGLDIVLPRLLADVPVTSQWLAGLGHGGLCLSCPECHFPNCGFGKGV